MKHILIFLFTVTAFTLSAQVQNAPVEDTNPMDSFEIHREDLGFENFFGDMGDTYKTMINSMMIATLEFYADEKNIQMLASINKSYYDALVKEGFTKEDALKIVISSSLPGSGMSSK